MPVTFGYILTRIQRSLGDPLAATWSRTADIWPWTVEAIREFVIPRPMEDEYTFIAASHHLTLPADFRQIIWVEYPIDQEPPIYLERKNHLDPEFYGSDDYYDIDRDYDTGTGYTLWLSRLFAADDKLRISYLADHEVPDDENDTLTIPERYLNLLILYVVWRAWAERLGKQMIDPTAHTSTIQQMSATVQNAEQAYKRAVADALQELAESRLTPNLTMD